MWWFVLSVAGGLLLLWVALLVALWLTKPDEISVKDALRLLPDIVRLIKRLTSDPAVPRGVRVLLGLLLAYLAMPIDLVPDFIPIIGYADDAMIVAIALRSVTRRAGPVALEKHWPGTPEGLAAIRRLSGISAGGLSSRDRSFHLNRRRDRSMG